MNTFLSDYLRHWIWHRNKLLLLVSDDEPKTSQPVSLPWSIDWIAPSFLVYPSVCPALVTSSPSPSLDATVTLVTPSPPFIPVTPVTPATPVTPVTPSSCIRGVRGVVKLIALTKKISSGNCLKWQTKSLFWHPAPSPLRVGSKKIDKKNFLRKRSNNFFGTLPPPPKKKNYQKKFLTGNGLKWQENWSNHFHGTLPPTHLSFMFLNQKTAKGIHEWYSKSKGQKQLDENTSVKKWEIFEITPLFFTAFQTFPVKMKSCEYDFQISFQNWLAIW